MPPGTNRRPDRTHPRYMYNSKDCRTTVTWAIDEEPDNSAGSSWRSPVAAAQVAVRCRGEGPQTSGATEEVAPAVVVVVQRRVDRGDRHAAHRIKHLSYGPAGLRARSVAGRRRRRRRRSDRPAAGRALTPGDDVGEDRQGDLGGRVGADVEPGWRHDTCS